MSNETKPLLRPTEGRWLLGVAAGLGHRLGVPAWALRVAFVLLFFAGGLGVLLYLAGWLLMPREGEEDALAAGWLNTDQNGRWAGVILVGVAVLFLISRTNFVGGDLVLALALICVGVLLYRGDLARPSRQDTVTPADEDPEPSPALAPEATDDSSASTDAPASSDTPPPAREPSFLSRVTLGFAVLVVGAVGLADALVGDFDPTFRHYTALPAAIVGLGAVIGAWYGRSGGVIVAGFILVPFLLLAPVVELVSQNLTVVEDWYSDDTVYWVASLEEILDEYQLGAGTLRLDLTQVDFSGETIQTQVNLGFGRVEVNLPDGVAAEVRGAVGVGILGVDSQERVGVGVNTTLRTEAPGDDGLLLLDVAVGVGEIVVR